MVGLSRVTLWKLVSGGEVEAARIGRAVRINRESLTDYMKRSAKNPAASGI
jgi:excisionase family DNA binding protein